MSSGENWLEYSPGRVAATPNWGGGCTSQVNYQFLDGLMFAARRRCPSRSAFRREVDFLLPHPAGNTPIEVVRCTVSGIRHRDTPLF